MASAPSIYQQNYSGFQPQSNGTPYPNTNPSFGVPPTQVEISVSCKNLIDKDILSKSDPFVVLFKEERDRNGKRWVECDRTEVIMDNLNPIFVKSFKLAYYFEEQQNLKFEVYDWDEDTRNLAKQDYLGHCIITLGSIVGEYCGKVTKPLLGIKNEKTNSTISFLAEELSNNKDMVELQFKGRKLDKKDFFGKSDPFLVFYRHGIENSEFIPSHKTEVIKNTLNPVWKTFRVSLVSLCNGDKSRPIKVECYDWNSNGTHELIGECNTTVDEMLSEKSSYSTELINQKIRSKKRKYKNSGWLDLISIDITTEASFLDYITGGTELCFHIAIDFTASNGNPNNPNSLHSLRPDVPNQYIQALMAVGKICEDYDSDKLIPAYGFGARIGGKVYHDFHLNQMSDPNCHGVAGVLEAYQRFLPYAELYGPTNFSPVINVVKNIAMSQGTYTKYHILLILTDGVISDMDRTISTIIETSRHPVSIIIVGVGNADFDAMDELDCDDGLLESRGKVAEQDIVQFVPFNKYSGQFAGEDLAREVLFEVPGQLVNFMKRKGVKPPPK